MEDDGRDEDSRYGCDHCGRTVKAQYEQGLKMFVCDKCYDNIREHGRDSKSEAQERG